MEKARQKRNPGLFGNGEEAGGSRGEEFSREEGNSTGNQRTVTDETDRQRLLAILNWETTVNSATARLSNALISPGASIERITNEALDIAKQVTGSRHGYVGSIDMKTKKLMTHALSRMAQNECAVDPETSARAFFPDETGQYPALWGFSFNERKGFFTNSPQNHPASRGIPAEHITINNFLSVPAMAGGELVGQISLANKPEPYTEQDLEVIQRFAELLALAIKRIQVEEALRESEKKYMDLFENASDGIFTTDLAGNIVSCNRAAAEIFGADDGKPVRMDLQQILTSESYAFVMRMFKRAVVKKSDLIDLQPWEVKVGKNDGMVRTFEVRTRMVWENDRIVGAHGISRDITERRRAEAALRESEEIFNQFMNHIPIYVFFKDENIRSVRLSKNYENLLGKPIAEIIGKTMDDLFPSDMAKSMIEDDRRVLREDKPIDVVEEFDGRIFTTTKFPIKLEGKPPLLAGFTIDITEHKLNEAKLKEYSSNLEEMVFERTKELNRSLFDTEESRDRIDVILKSIREGIIVTNIHKRVVLMNHAAEDLIRIHLSDVINRSIEFAITDTDFDFHLQEAIDRNENQRFLFLSEDQHGRTAYLQANASLIRDKKGSKTGIVISFHDVTEEHEIDRMKTEFISTAAHEFKSPLTSILGYSELLDEIDTIAPEDRKKMIACIHTQARKLAKIVNDLLDISRIESGFGLELKKEMTDVRELITNVVGEYQKISPKHTFVVSIPEHDRTLLVDPQKMEQVFNNILSNAVKYSPAGGAVTVTGKSNETHYEIQVCDEGIGMTPSEINRIFEKFYRADASNSAIEGTGLGMSIVEYLVREHGGTVRVESEKNQGTCIIVQLPK